MELSSRGLTHCINKQLSNFGKDELVQFIKEVDDFALGFAVSATMILDERVIVDSNAYSRKGQIVEAEWKFTSENISNLAVPFWFKIIRDYGLKIRVTVNKEMLHWRRRKNDFNFSFDTLAKNKEKNDLRWFKFHFTTIDELNEFLIEAIEMYKEG